MSRFSEKGYIFRENAPINLTQDMDRTVRWFEDVLGWYGNIVERDGQERGLYGVVFDVPPEVEAAHLAPFTGFQLFSGDPAGHELSFMQVEGIQLLYEFVREKGWN